MTNNKFDFARAKTVQIEAVNQPHVDVYGMINSLLDAGLISVIVQYKKLSFGVSRLYPLENGWLDCVMNDPELIDGNIRIIIQQGLPLTVYVGEKTFIS